MTRPGEAVHASYLSHLKSERCHASEEFKDLKRDYPKEGRELVEKLKKVSCNYFFNVLLLPYL